MISRNEMLAEIELETKLRNKISEEVKHLPKGELVFRKQKGHHRPFLKRAGKEKYINKQEQELLNKLMRKKELSRAIELIDKNIVSLTSALESFTDFNVLIPRHTINPINNKSQDDIYYELSRIMNEKNEEKPDWEFNQKLITNDGTQVRSRVELVIYEFLKLHNIRFKYEHPIIIEGNTYYPDFTIYKDDGSIIIWEHFGMMADSDYRRNAIYKFGKYLEAGYYPFVNLICTYEFEDGNIDLRYIENILKAFDIIHAKPENSSLNS